MNKKYLLILLVSFIGLSIAFSSCKGKSRGSRGTLNIRISADLDMLNPLNLGTADARKVVDLIFSSLITQNPVPGYDLLPYLIKEKAKVTELSNNRMQLDYEIRDEAVWDDGKPITGYDYAFTIKCILNPKTNNEPLKSYYDWLEDVVVDSTNPKKFSVFANKKYYRIEEFAGLYVMPEHIYDKSGLMKKFTIQDMNTSGKREALKSNADILNFAQEFNSEKFQRDPAVISGSGPYKLDHWTTGQEVVLVKKDSWWGDKFAEERPYWSFPKRIKIKIINDDNTAITALKDMQIDNFVALRAKDYKELEKNADFTSKFNMGKVGRFSYGFIGINLRKDKFKDLKVRQALAHAVNRDKINEILSFGESKKAESFAHPSQKAYNHDLKEFVFDLDQSAKLLDEAGWKDTDGDGVRDKVINGRKTDFTIDFKYAKAESTKDMLLILKEDLKKIGINLIMIEKEWTVYVAELDKHDFEMYSIGFTIDPNMSDPKQQWHTSSSVPGGSNNVGWGNSTSDKLIEDIDAELNEDKRIAMYKRLQQMVHDDVPVIFMFNGVNRIATNKNFEVENIMISPGVLYNEFKAVQ